MICRLRIVGYDVSPHNPNHLHSYEVTKDHLNVTSFVSFGTPFRTPHTRTQAAIEPACCCLLSGWPVSTLRDKFGEASMPLHDFTGGTTDRGVPVGNVILDAAGNLYSTTMTGGGTPGMRGERSLRSRDK